MSRILIKNGRLWTGGTFCDGDILTEGKYIKRIASKIDESADYTFHANGKMVLPGLVDLHVHMKGVAPDAFGINAEMSSLPFGVTAVNDAGSVYCSKEVLDYMTVKSTVFVGVEIKQGNFLVADLEARLGKYGDRVIGLKIYFDKTIAEVYNINSLREVCKFARAKKLKVMVHCSNSPTSMKEIIETLAEGDILTHAFHGGIHSCAEDDFECLRFAKKKGIIVDAGFAGHVHTDFQILEKAIKMGCLPDTISTDITKYSAYIRGGRYGMTMCMSMVRRLGMKEEDILRAVAETPAMVLGKTDEWGYLLEGRCADIAVLDYTDESFCLQDKAGNVLEGTKGYRCVLTISDGQIVYKD